MIILKNFLYRDTIDLIDPDNVKNINNNTLLHEDPRTRNVLVNEIRGNVIYMMIWLEIYIY